MVPLDRALVSSYRLSIVTTPLTEAVWLQFAMQAFVCSQYPRLRGNESHSGSKLVPQGSGQAGLFASLDSFSVRCACHVDCGRRWKADTQVGGVQTSLWCRSSRWIRGRSINTGLVCWLAWYHTDITGTILRLCHIHTTSTAAAVVVPASYPITTPWHIRSCITTHPLITSSYSNQQLQSCAKDGDSLWLHTEHCADCMLHAEQFVCL